MRHALCRLPVQDLSDQSLFGSKSILEGDQATLVERSGRSAASEAACEYRFTRPTDLRFDLQ